MQIYYNIYSKIKDLDTGFCSGRLLYESFKHTNNKNVMKIITNLTLKVGTGKTIWGCKKKNSEIRWEIYFYHYDMSYPEIGSGFDNVNFNFNLPKDNDIVIHSFDLYKEGMGPELHLYKKDSPLTIPFFGNGTTILNNVETKESVFIVDTYLNFFFNFNKYMKYLNFDDIEIDINILKSYKCDFISIHNKGNNSIFIQYLGISNTDFLLFLEEYEYPYNLIQHFKKNLLNYKSISHEITIVSCLKNKKVLRTGFYGIV